VVPPAINQKLRQRTNVSELIQPSKTGRSRYARKEQEMGINTRISVRKPAVRVGRSIKWQKILVPYAFLFPFILFFVIFRMAPALFGIGLSFAKWSLFEGTQEFVGLNNFVLLMQDRIFWISLKNSFIIAILSTTGIVVVAMAAAVGLRSVTRGQTFYRVFLYLPTILAISVVGIVWQRVLSNNGLINYFINWLGGKTVAFLGDPNIVLGTLSGVTVWWSFGFPMLTFLAALYAVPVSLYEAAELDGASGWQAFFKITLPLVQPALLFVMVTQFIGHMQVFGQAYVLTQGGPGYASYPVILYLYQTAWRYYHMGYASAIAVSLAIVLLIGSIVQIKFLGKRVEF
jgi:multiple sugar transport system permease protein